MTDAIFFLFFVAIWRRKKNNETLIALRYKPQGYNGVGMVLRFFIFQSKNELKFSENYVHQIIEIIDKMSA